MNLDWTGLLSIAAVSLLLALVAWRRGTVSTNGMVGGFFVGLWIGGFGGWAAFGILTVFFIMGSAATKLGFSKKAKAGLAQEGGGRRGSKHALANCGSGMLAALFIPGAFAPLAGVALVAAFATAASDTLGSEIGQLYGKRPINPLTFRAVAPGSEGAVSLEGTFAGVAGSLLMAILGAAMGLYGWGWVALPVVGAFVGTGVESLVGARWGADGAIGNEMMNFLNTVVGALTALLLGLALGVPTGL